MSRFCHQEVLAEDMRGWRGRAKAGAGQGLSGHQHLWGSVGRKGQETGPGQSR